MPASCPSPVAIIGASGQLGSALRDAFADRVVLAPSHAELSLEDRGAVARFLDTTKPAVLVNCAAFHQVDLCERDPHRAFAVNAVAVDYTADACAARGVAFATMSTDYVFDGALGRAYHEDDPAAPQTAYGVSKLAGELMARRHGPRHYIFRTSGLFGISGMSNKGYALIEKALRQAESGVTTRMVADVTFSPAYAPHVARAIRGAVDTQAYGTHHVTNVGECTWYDFVATAFRKAGLADAPLERVTYAALGNPTKRPKYSPLVNTTFHDAGIAPLPTWEEALDDYLATRRARLSGAHV